MLLMQMDINYPLKNQKNKKFNFAKIWILASKNASNINGYKLPPKYRKIRINFVNIGIQKVKIGVPVSKNTKHFHIAL